RVAIQEQSAVEWFSKEYSRSSFTLAFILLSAWGVTSFGHAYGRPLKANESFTKGFMAVARLDVIVDALDHLAVDQQAFLSRDDESFQDDVVVSVETLELNIDMLNSLPAKDTSRRALPVELSRSIKQVITNRSESNRIRETDNRAAAVDFFASKGDDV